MKLYSGHSCQALFPFHNRFLIQNHPRRMFAATQRRLEQLLSPQLCLRPSGSSVGSSIRGGVMASVAWEELSTASASLLDTWQRRPGEGYLCEHSVK